MTFANFSTHSSLLSSVCWLVLISFVAICYSVVQLRRTDYSLWENCLYLPTYLMGRLMWRVHFQNEAPPELRSGAILAANHRSSVDPFFVQLAAKRRVHWMVAKEFCQHPIFGPVLSALQVIPTNRSGMDTRATKAAMRLTAEGKLVGMFPEGKINWTTTLLLPVRSGVAVVAQRAQVPIIPLFIDGSPMRDAVLSPVFMPASVKITFGRPISVSHPSSGGATTSKAESQRACDAALLDWGQQMATMAQQPLFKTQLAAARAERRSQTA